MGSKIREVTHQSWIQNPGYSDGFLPADFYYMVTEKLIKGDFCYDIIEHRARWGNEGRGSSQEGQ